MTALLGYQSLARYGSLGIDLVWDHDYSHEPQKGEGRSKSRQGGEHLADGEGAKGALADQPVS